MQRSILLQINPTKRKYAELKDFSNKATAEYNRLRAERDFCSKFMDFHRKVYSASKINTSFNSNIICSIERSVWRSKGISNGITVKFSMTRNCRTFHKTMTFVRFGIYTHKNIAVPIVKNRNSQRYESLLSNGWVCKTYGLTHDLQIVAYLSKEDVQLPIRKNVLGIDFNAKRIAVTVLSPHNKVLYQTYFGLNIWIKRKKIMNRRSRMQSSNNLSALRRLKTREYDFVDTNIGQMVREIIDVALRFDADIAIENLKRFMPKGRKFNKIVMRMPFRKFKEILTSRCFDKRITLNIIDSWHTSKFCSHCGAVARSGHSSTNYALFRCKECGIEVNSDRNASRNIALKCLLEREMHSNQIISQISNRSGLVNAHKVMSDESSLICSVNHINQLDGKPSPLGGG